MKPLNKLNNLKGCIDMDRLTIFDNCKTGEARIDHWKTPKDLDRITMFDNCEVGDVKIDH